LIALTRMYAAVCGASDLRRAPSPSKSATRTRHPYLLADLRRPLDVDEVFFGEVLGLFGRGGADATICVWSSVGSALVPRRGRTILFDQELPLPARTGYQTGRHQGKIRKGRYQTGAALPFAKTRAVRRLNHHALVTPGSPRELRPPIRSAIHRDDGERDLGVSLTAGWMVCSPVLEQLHQLLGPVRVFQVPGLDPRGPGKTLFVTADSRGDLDAPPKAQVLQSRRAPIRRSRVRRRLRSTRWRIAIEQIGGLEVH